MRLTSRGRQIVWIYPALEPSFKRSPAAATQVRPAGEIPRLAAMPRWKLVGIAKRVVVNDLGFMEGMGFMIFIIPMLPIIPMRFVAICHSTFPSTEHPRQCSSDQ